MSFMAVGKLDLYFSIQAYIIEKREKKAKILPTGSLWKGALLYVFKSSRSDQVCERKIIDFVYSL